MNSTRSGKYALVVFKIIVVNLYFFSSSLMIALISAWNLNYLCENVLWNRYNVSIYIHSNNTAVMPNPSACSKKNWFRSKLFDRVLRAGHFFFIKFVAFSKNRYDWERKTLVYLRRCSTLIFENLIPVEISKNHFNFTWTS